jgi:hypothetical protein
VRIESAVAGKGSLVSIVVSHKAADLSDQITDAAERAPADRPMGDEPESTLDLIAPVRVGGRVIEVKARMAGESRLDGTFLSGVVSGAQVRLKFGGNVVIETPGNGGVLHCTNSLMGRVERPAAEPLAYQRRDRPE